MWLYHVCVFHILKTELSLQVFQSIFSRNFDRWILEYFIWYYLFLKHVVVTGKELSPALPICIRDTSLTPKHFFSVNVLKRFANNYVHVSSCFSLLICKDFYIWVNLIFINWKSTWAISVTKCLLSANILKLVHQKIKALFSYYGRHKSNVSLNFLNFLWKSYPSLNILFLARVIWNALFIEFKICYIWNA